MSPRNRTLWVLVAIALCLAACSPQTVQTPVQEASPYVDILGQPLNSPAVMDWMTVNDCVSATQFQLCKDAGMAFWLDAGQTLKQVYLYLNNKDGFAPYKGKLPMGLKFYDTLGAVEYKLKRQGIGIGGLPDETGTPDHMHYWATYNQAGMTVIYNAPFPDEDATIYAIVMSV